MKETLYFVMTLVVSTRCTLFLSSIVVLWIATGILKEKQVLRESDSRKINHIFVFVGGALVFGWLPEITARASLYIVATIVLLLVTIACCYKNNKPFSYIYNANTRASDSPNTTFLFLSSWCISIAALAAVDLLFTSMCITRTAILVVGLADGIAEPVGRRFGQHRYAVVSFNQQPSSRSLEGSLTVWVVTLLVILCSTHAPSFWYQCLSAIAIASAITLVEAISPRGCDNFSILLTAAFLTQQLLTTN